MGILLLLIILLCMIIVVWLYRFLIFFIMWVDSNISVCLLIFISKLCKCWCLSGLRFVVGLFRIINFGLFNSVCVILKCWCMLFENWVIVLFVIVVKFVNDSSEDICVFILFLFIFFSEVMCFKSCW